MVTKITYRLILLLALLVWLPACRELPLIGDLAGQWQITEIHYADGDEIRMPGRYYCFYRHTAQLTAPGNVKHTANMVYDKPELSLEFPEVSPVHLKEWGITAPDDADDATRGWVERFHIDRLDNSHLVMTSARGNRIIMRKY